jgi:calcium-translocating P-type ATPase
MMASRAWHSDPIEKVVQSLQSNRDGLSESEAQARLLRVGPNRLPREAPPGPLFIFLRQFKNPLVYLLVLATVISVAIGALLDAVFIFIVLLFNAAIGTMQEWQAQRKAEELAALVPHRAVVRRGGDWQEVDTETLVPGDAVRIVRGDRASADLRLAGTQALTVDESLLTGESTAVDKSADATLPADAPMSDRTTMLFAGSTVMSGRGEAFVVATAGDTEIGRIARAVISGETVPPPLVRQLDAFSRTIGVVTLVLIGIVAFAEAMQGTPLATVFLVAIALAVAAIPEGLPVAITVALAIATSRMQRRNVLVRSLPAVEGLGACTLIASDKTGTLTRNELTVASVGLSFDDGTCRVVAIDDNGGITSDDEPRLRDLALAGVICNEAEVRTADDRIDYVGDTVDISFLKLAAKIGFDIAAVRAGAPLADSIPYEPELRFAAAFVKSPMNPADSDTAYVKGAAEAILPMCGPTDFTAFETEIDRLAAAGYRIIAVARGTLATSSLRADPTAALTGLDLLGFAAIIDPLRTEAVAAIGECRNAGISVRMVTGDHPATAAAIARQLGIATGPDDVATGAEIDAVSQSGHSLAEYVVNKTVFARVEPFQKLAIVQAFQEAGHVVTVTGDGVNDAPALTTADIGVAMGRSGTDVARGAADLVLADDNFASIVAGIEEGRIAYDNVRKLIYLLISTGLGEIVLFVLAISFGLPVPLFAVQLLWLNLVTNGIQDVALAFEKGEPGINKRPPRRLGTRLFDARMITQVLFAGSHMGIVCFLAYAWFLNQGFAVDQARNLVLLLMVLFENAHALNARSERLSVFKVPISSNWFLLIAIIGAQGIHITSLYTDHISDVLRVNPIGLSEWILVAAFAVSQIVVVEVFKWVVAKFDLFDNTRTQYADRDQGLGQ